MGFILCFHWLKKKRRDINKRNVILEKVGNIAIKIPNHNEGDIFNTSTWVINELLMPLSVSFRGAADQKVTEGYFTDLKAILCDSFKAYGTTFKNPFAQDIALCIEGIDVEEVCSELLQEGNYPVLPISDIKTYLKYALEFGNIQFYNFLVLALDLGLRPGDINKISPSHILPGNVINVREPVNGDYLISKMARGKKVDPLDLTNPKISYLSRVIVKYLGASDSKAPPSFFKNINSPTSARLHILTPNGHFRSFRTCFATYSMWSRNSKIGGYIDSFGIQASMAHTTTTLLESVYAKKLPKDATGGDIQGIDDYLQLDRIVLAHPVDNKIEIDISQLGSAWTLWLTHHLLDTYKRFSTEGEYQKLLTSIAEEAVGVSRAQHVAKIRKN